VFLTEFTSPYREADVKGAEEWEYKYVKTFRLGVCGRLGEHFTDTIGAACGGYCWK